MTAVRERKGAAVDTALTGRVKDFALQELGADLVGIANIERFKNAPAMMSPQGIMPTAKSVVVMAIRHPDGCVEMGGITHPQDIGPYSMQYTMNCRLDEMSYRMGMFLEDQGFAAVPIVSSNIWRYKGYKDLKENFAPDVSHLHSAVAAGLSEFGYSGLSITPEFGARQRYVTIITDAVLEPTPLIEPGSVCDHCNLCVKNCRSGALSKEIDGWNIVEIEDKTYKYAKKNLWRCAWGEHFDLDLDLPIPEHVDEAVILENLRKHGTRGGEMGSCLRYCLPKSVRSFDREYTNAPRRIRYRAPEGPNRALDQKLKSLAYGRGIDFVMVSSAEELTGMGIDAKKYLPDAKNAVIFGIHFEEFTENKGIDAAAYYMLSKLAYDANRMVEDAGYNAVCATRFPGDTYVKHIDGILPGRRVTFQALITSAPIKSTSRTIPAAHTANFGPSETKTHLIDLLRGLGADMVGVSPASRLAQIQPELAKIFDGQEYLVARDTSNNIRLEYQPEISTEVVRTLTPDDHLKGAKNVIVIGLRIPGATVDRTAQPPAEAVGPYTFAQIESTVLLNLMAYRAARQLQDAGYRTAVTSDLCGTGSLIGSPRGEKPDAFCNRFAAVAAGLGHIGRGGFVVTPRFGSNVRFIAIVTDAEIEADPVDTDKSYLAACNGCTKCVSACRTHAHTKEASVNVGGSEEKFMVVDRGFCDWAKRYSLIPEEGVSFTGWNLSVPLPKKITAENLAEGLKQYPPIGKIRPCNFEACVLACPHSGCRDSR